MNIFSSSEKNKREKESNVRVIGIDTFVSKSEYVHGGIYDYSKTVYSTSKGKVEIICHDHGSFWQEAESHHRGRGCPYCRSISIGNAHRHSTDTLIESAKKKHGEKYDYSLIGAVSSSKDKVICPVEGHGAFSKVFSAHIFGQGCPQCSKDADQKSKIPYTEVLRRMRTIHGDSYTYLTSEEDYKTLRSLISIECNTCHSIFEQRASNHIKGQGCRTCSYAKRGYYSLGYLNFHEEQRTKKAYVYLLSAIDAAGDENFVKFGVTINPYNRLKSLNSESSYDFSEIALKETTLQRAIEIERKISQTVLNNKERYTPKNKFMGYTECTNTSFLEELRKLLGENHAID